MKTLLEIDTWSRKEHFEFFNKFEEPFFGVAVEINCTEAYRKAKGSGASFFIYYLHKTLVAINAIECFRYRISGDKVYVYDKIDASATIAREDGTFGFSFIPYDPDFTEFNAIAEAEIKRVKSTKGLFIKGFDHGNLIHFSAVPWINFTGLSHARSFTFPDSCPKIAFGKMAIDEKGNRTMAMSVHVHHALMDGVHLGQFITAFQEMMNEGPALGKP